MGRPKKIKSVSQETKTKVTSKKSSQEPIYDEFGICINCKGDVEGCPHTNLIQDGRTIRCVNCGLIINQ